MEGLRGGTLRLMETTNTQTERISQIKNYKLKLILRLQFTNYKLNAIDEERDLSYRQPFSFL